MIHKIRHQPFVGLIERRVVRPFFFDPPKKLTIFVRLQLVTVIQVPGTKGCPWTMTRRGQVQSDWSIVGISEISLI